MTLEAWVFPTAFNGSWQSVISKPIDPGFTSISYVLQGASATSGLPSVATSLSLSNLYGATPLPMNTWSHLAATYDGSIVRLYVNGTQVASRSQTGLVNTSTQPLTIGLGWPGTIDELRIYNRALSPSEIQRDMNTPVGGRPTPPSGLHVVGSG
jgi:hypothetical protein